jgi:hypothetical protein
MKKTGGTFQSYISSLRVAGYVVTEREDVVITETGFRESGVDPDAEPLTAEEVRAMWATKLKAGARRILDVLIEAYPNGVTKESIAQAVEMEPSGGTFQSYLSTLRVNGLAEGSDGTMRATPVVMGQ